MWQWERIYKYILKYGKLFKRIFGLPVEPHAPIYQSVVTLKIWCSPLTIFNYTNIVYHFSSIFVLRWTVKNGWQNKAMKINYHIFSVQFMIYRNIHWQPLAKKSNDTSMFFSLQLSHYCIMHLVFFSKYHPISKDILY